MSQAALNHRDKDENKKDTSAFRSQFVGLFFLLVVVVAVVWCGWMVIKWMKDAEYHPISKLVISGDLRYSKDNDVREAILLLGEPKTFMTQNVDVLQQQIKRLMPWVKLVSIRKQWPDELKIHLVEYAPFTFWNDQLLLDSAGNEFVVPFDRMGKQPYPLLYGPEGEGKRVLDEYYQIVKLLSEKGFTPKIVELTARSSWQLTLTNGIRLALGRKDNRDRIARFIALYPELIQQIPVGQRIDYVDLRYETGAAVGWTTEFVDYHIDKSTE